jgi:hypothetical protein
MDNDLESEGQYAGEERRNGWRVAAADLSEDLSDLRGRVTAMADMQHQTHRLISDHVAEERQTKAAVDELVTLWRGSKLMVSGMKILIPIVAALVGAALWIKEHVRW